MKANTKEILNNKAVKMIDLLFDEIKEDPGSRMLFTAFKDEKRHMVYRLDVQLTSAKEDIPDDPVIVDPIEEVKTKVQELTTITSSLVDVIDSLTTRVSALEAIINNNEEPEPTEPEEQTEP